MRKASPSLLLLAAACALWVVPAEAQVSCQYNAKTFTAFLPGGGTINIDSLTPSALVDFAPGSKLDLGAYCEGVGQFPPPVIAGATYSWSPGGATSQRIEAIAPAAGVSVPYSVTIASPAGTKTVGFSIRGAPSGSPICNVVSNAAQPMKPDVPFSLRAVCTPAPTTYQWDWREFTGKIALVSGQGTATPTFVVTSAQAGEVLPIYLIAKIGTTTGPYASTLITAGLPAVVTTAGIAAGGTHTCAVTTTGGPKCWGDNAFGQVGIGRSAIDVAAPLNVIGNAGNSASITSGASHACVRTTEGNARCWGDNTRGQVGDDNLVGGYFGVNVVGLANATSVVSGPGSYHTCAVTTAGGVKCWGANESSQLGNGTFADSRRAVDATAFGASGIARVATGVSHTCVLTTAGAVRCLGSNQYGQLGDGTLASRTTAVTVVGLGSGVVDIALGTYHSCAVLSNGSVRCWGRGASGELGSGVAVPFAAQPVTVSGLAGATQVSAGEAHTCAVAAGAARCWGRNIEGQLGDGTLSNRLAPATVSGLGSGVLSVSAGGFHACARVVGETAVCWGRNLAGQLGDGTYAFKVRPSPVHAAANSSGQLDANDWYLRLDPAGSGSVPSAFVPKALAEATRTPAGALSATVRYKAAEANKVLDNFVVAFVPPEFFAEVKVAPGTPDVKALRTKANGGLVFAQLTPKGWTNVANELIAYARSTEGGTSGSIRILDSTPLATLPPGTRFCIGYGEGSAGAIQSQTFVEVQNVEGAITSSEGRPCILSGVYLHGLRSSTVGTRVAFGASIVGTSPTGTVQFTDDGQNLQGPVAVTLADGEQGVARAAVSAALPVGIHSIGASYSGDSQNTWAQGLAVVPLVHSVAGTASVALTGDVSSRLGAETRFAATVTGNNPTGTVQFRDNGTDLGAPQPLREGQAVLALATLGTGSHALTAAYSGDATNQAATSPPWEHRVEPLIATTISLSSSPNPSLDGATATFTASVGGNNPTGTVRFRNGSVVLGQPGLQAGTAAIATSSLAVAVHTISADYLGDANHAPVTATAYHRVDPIPRAASATSIAASSNPSALLQAVTFTATVTGTPAASGGTVTFRASAAAIPGCSALPLSGSTATCATSLLPSGDNVITASYSGDANLDGSTSLALKQVVSGGSPAVGASPAALDFGGQSMNTTSLPLSTTLTNASLASFTVASVTASPGFALAGNNCGTLAPGASCQVSVRTTPTAAGPMIGLLAISLAGGGSAAVALRAEGERSLTTHYYQSILRRSPDSGGKLFWENQAARVSSLGANPNETWFAMAQQFYASGEYAAFNRDTTGFATDLYNTFFNRAPDAGGLAYWTGQLASGLPREVALASFMFSPEFAAFTTAIFGNAAVRAEIYAVTDFYRGLLARLPDDGGFNFWVGRFRAAQCQGAPAVTQAAEDISSAFTLSPEYAARARSNAQYVGDLYNAFLRRGGDLTGVQYWINQVASGARTREQVRVEFRKSPEFQGRVAAIIQQGCMP